MTGVQTCALPILGDVITTEKDIHSPLVACVEGVPKFHASPGAFKGRKAIRVDQVLGDPPKTDGK